jgi:hypothetical protein
MNLTFLIFVTCRWPAVLLAAPPHSVRRQQKSPPLGWLLTRPGDRPPICAKTYAASPLLPSRYAVLLLHPPPSVDHSNSK